MFETKFTEGSQEFNTQLHGVVSNGQNGLSAYEIAVKNGFEGTEDEWLASLKGEQGPQGPQGVQGEQGIQGEKGDKGEQGPKGDQGEQGNQGPKGDKGDKGATGEQGIQGEKGDTGPQGPQGEQGAKGDIGEKGDTGADGKDGYTPIKGVDYFTETDKTEMVAAVKNQLIVEQWTFTLIDDTVVTKDVIME